MRTRFLSNLGNHRPFPCQRDPGIFDINSLSTSRQSPGLSASVCESRKTTPGVCRLYSYRLSAGHRSFDNGDRGTWHRRSLCDHPNQLFIGFAAFGWRGDRDHKAARVRMENLTSRCTRVHRYFDAQVFRSEPNPGWSDRHARLVTRRRGLGHGGWSVSTTPARTESR
jgi:hypothetical protein